MFLYIHGFASSGQSYKGRVLQIAFGRENVLTPDLSTDPDEAMSLLCRQCDELQAREKPVMLLGSSLGGFYATYLSHKYGFPAILVNPSVTPHETLKLGLGLNPKYTGHTDFFLFTKENLLSFDKYYVSGIDESKILLLLQSGDIILDYRKAIERYPNAHHIVIDGGSHGFDQFEDQINTIRAFYRTQLDVEI